MNTSGWVISCCRFKCVCVVVFVPFKLVFSKKGCHVLRMVDFGCVLGGCGKQKGIFLSGFLELLLVEGVRLPILTSWTAMACPVLQSKMFVVVGLPCGSGR